jgi:hypothetical protein
MNKEQDDLTLVYMWAYKQAEKEYKDRIEELQTTLKMFLTLPMYREGCGCGFCVIVDDTRKIIKE